MTTVSISNVKFDLGEMYVNRRLYEKLQPCELWRGLGLHARGDWGMVEPDNWAANDKALEEGETVRSVYEGRSGQKFTVITDLGTQTTSVGFAEDHP